MNRINNTSEVVPFRKQEQAQIIMKGPMGWVMINLSSRDGTAHSVFLLPALDIRRSEHSFVHGWMKEPEAQVRKPKTFLNDEDATLKVETNIENSKESHPTPSKVYLRLRAGFVNDQISGKAAIVSSFVIYQTQYNQANLPIIEHKKRIRLNEQISNIEWDTEILPETASLGLGVYCPRDLRGYLILLENHCEIIPG